jgi:hypothetical protein
VSRALEGAPPDTRALQLVALARPSRPLATWAGPEVEAVAFPGGDLLTAGASGVWHARRGDLTPGLPSRRATALALWAGEAVVALEAGGVAVELSHEAALSAYAFGVGRMARVDLMVRQEQEDLARRIIEEYHAGTLAEPDDSPSSPPEPHG